MAFVIILLASPPIVGIIVAITLPRALGARQSANEASAIAAMRAINSAQATYAELCGGGGYAQTVADLAKAPVDGGFGFIEPGLASGQHNGYYVTIEYDPDAVDVLPGSTTCNGADNNPRSAYFAHAEPIETGRTGRRSFATNQTGIIYENETGTPIPRSLFGAEILQQ